MKAVSVLLRGEGWGLPQPLLLQHAVDRVEAREPGELPSLLDWLDEVASSGDRDAIAAGFVTYEAGVWLEGSPALYRPPERTPLAFFARYRLGEGSASGALPEIAARAATAAEGSLSREGWAAGVQTIRTGIERGDVYQVNLTRRMTLDAHPPAAALAEALYGDNPVPYAMTLATGRFAVVSNSPELFLRVDLGAGVAESAPIKGTIACGPGAQERLLASAKDAAEHLMIVDLLRNDLGRVARPGAVAVPEFRTVRTFRHLHHLESTVAARLQPGVRLSDILLATLPGGSITGAPKRAALRFVRELEPCARGPYTGAAGYVRGDGTAVFNVAIRTAILSPAGLDYHAGGGIVWDSDPQAEWEETETKSRELAAALEKMGAR